MEKTSTYLSSDIKLIKSELPPFMYYMDGKKHVAYSRALEIKACGLTKEEAENSLMQKLEEFIKLHKNQDTLESEMKKLGWEFDNGLWIYMAKKTFRV